MSYKTSLYVWNVYVRKGTAYIPDVALVKDGFNLDVEPVRVVDLQDIPSLVTAIHSAMTRGNPNIPKLPPGPFPKPVILEPAGVKSWAAFERRSACFSIWKDEREIEITETGRDGSGRWSDDPAVVVVQTFSKDASAADIANCIVKRASQRADLI
jgi:hypothetical protein